MMNKNKKGNICISKFFHTHYWLHSYIISSALRQTTGIAKATGKHLLPANSSYGHICKRINNLNIDIKRGKIYDDDPIISVDDTGIKITD